MRLQYTAALIIATIGGFSCSDATGSDLDSDASTKSQMRLTRRRFGGQREDRPAISRCEAPAEAGDSRPPSDDASDGDDDETPVPTTIRPHARRARKVHYGEAGAGAGSGAGASTDDVTLDIIEDESDPRRRYARMVRAVKDYFLYNQWDPETYGFPKDMNISSLDTRGLVSVISRLRAETKASNPVVTWRKTMETLPDLVGRETAEIYIQARTQHLLDRYPETPTLNKLYKAIVETAEGINHDLVMRFSKLDLYFLLGKRLADTMMKRRALLMYLTGGPAQQLAERLGNYEYEAVANLTIRAVNRLKKYPNEDFVSLVNKKAIIALMGEEEGNEFLRIQSKSVLKRIREQLGDAPGAVAIATKATRTAQELGMALKQLVPRMGAQWRAILKPEFFQELKFLFGAPLARSLVRRERAALETVFPGADIPHKTRHWWKPLCFSK